MGQKVGITIFNDAIAKRVDNNLSAFNKKKDFFYKNEILTKSRK